VSIILGGDKFSYLYRTKFDFLLGFSANHVLPGVVVPYILTFLDRVFIYRWDIFESFQTAATLDPTVGSSTPINLIFNDEGEVKSLQVVLSSGDAPWGLITKCGNPACEGLNIRTRFRRLDRGPVPHDYVKVTCSCGWVCKWTKYPDWLKPVKGRYFIHSFPLDESQQGFLTTKGID
jgi:hypothetical protein